MVMITWLADVLREAGLKVEESPGWKTKGRGPMGTPKGVMLHHTAGPKSGNSPSLRIVRDGRSDLPGPLSHLFLARDGTYIVIGAGRTNHAGRGSWQGASGNSSFIGIEAENAGDGTDPWPDAQIDAYERGVAALLTKIGADAVMAVGHKEYAKPRGRKIDPAFDMVEFRENVESIMGPDATVRRPVRTEDPIRVMLRKGDRGESVRVLQQKLGIITDGIFGPDTQSAVKEFQREHSLVVDGIVGPATWKALGE